MASCIMLERPHKIDNIPTVEMTTKAMEMQEMTLAAMEVWGFSMRSHRQIWYLTNFPLPKSSSTCGKISTYHPQTENLSHLFLNIVGFFLHLLDNVFLPCVVFILTAGFQVNLNNYVLITLYSFLTTCSSMLCK